MYSTIGSCCSAEGEVDVAAGPSAADDEREQRQQVLTVHHYTDTVIHSRSQRSTVR
jgi:hypothetical protein